MMGLISWSSHPPAPKSFSRFLSWNKVPGNFPEWGYPVCREWSLTAWQVEDRAWWHMATVCWERLVTAEGAHTSCGLHEPSGLGVPGALARWPAFLTQQPSHSHCSSWASQTAYLCSPLQWAVLSPRSCSSEEREQKVREGCEGSWEAETELGDFKVHDPDASVFILRRRFTNFRLPDLLEPLIQTPEM